MTRILVTGAGVECALGGLEDVWQTLCNMGSAVAMHQVPGVDGLPAVPGAPVRACRPVAYLPDRKLLKYMSPATAMAVMAAGRCLEHAGVLGREDLLEHAALYVCTGLIGFDVSSVQRALEASCSDNGELDLPRMGREGFRLCHPLMPFKMLLNMPLGMVSIALGLRGDNAIFYPGVDQSAACLEVAARGIRQGRFSRVLVGATANPMSLMPLCTLSRQGRLARSVEAAVPGSAGHDGVAPADAAAFVLLESEQAAEERGAAALAEIEGVAVGRSYDPDPGARFCARAELWSELCGETRPGAVLSMGNVDARDDEAEALATEATWPGQPPPSISHEGQVGYQDAAALPFCLALNAINPSSPLSPDEPAPGSFQMLLSAGDPDGGHGAVLLGAPFKGPGVPT